MGGADLNDDPNGFCEKLECGMSRVRGLPRLCRLQRRRHAGGRQRLVRIRVNRGGHPAVVEASSSTSNILSAVVIVCFEQLQRCGTTADSGQAGPLRTMKGGRKD
ncbi:hypothetical protein quinque_007504 [Culex quinquefasciatus]